MSHVHLQNGPKLFLGGDGRFLLVQSAAARGGGGGGCRGPFLISKPCPLAFDPLWR